MYCINIQTSSDEFIEQNFENKNNKWLRIAGEKDGKTSQKAHVETSVYIISQNEGVIVMRLAQFPVRSQVTEDSGVVCSYYDKIELQITRYMNSCAWDGGVCLKRENFNFDL